MAQRRSQLDMDSISCSICLDVMKDPVTIPCGHSYCMGCIKNYWDGEEQNEKESCPQCRKAFTPRPALVKNTILSFLVEQLNRTELLILKRSQVQKELNVSLQKTQQRIQDREEEVKLLQEEEDAINCSAEKALEDSETIFSELIRLLEKRRSEVKQQIKTGQETEVTRVRDFQKNLEEEIFELKSRETELNEIPGHPDHTEFLQSYNLVTPLSESTNTSSIKTRPLRYFEDVTAAVTEVRDILQGALRSDISLTSSKVDVKPEPKTRAEVSGYSDIITLKANTANCLFSEGYGEETDIYTDLYSSP
ncbi:hypothetical protein OYC64_018376 [Pagothenia borchgrevinki]|uniref:RING-type domain-containing protein n=1 Tax=Pagothenia borchgrevinki TaxID=8213 RepID=A0ABD2GNI8_PAGBO